jgi:predicted GNAT superfamily acetyltransferase
LPGPGKRIRVRPLETFEDFHKLLPIQKAVWGHADIDLTPVHQFCVSSHLGAMILGVFLGRDLAGFVYSFPGIHNGTVCQHSHLLAVLPEHQGFGLGKCLKWAQREEAIRRGFDLITWTFDPLKTRNARLNLQTLGAGSRTYLHNFYGLTPALCPGPGIPTDRLFVEWRIRDPQVEARSGRKTAREDSDPARFPKALDRKAKPEAGSDLFAPRRPSLDIDAPAILVEVPRDIRAAGSPPDLIARWQSALRRVMTRYFARGFHAGGFLFGDRCFYVLRRSPEF